MRRIGSSPFSFPDFRGATRTLVFVNLAAYFAFLLAQLLSAETAASRLRPAGLRSRLLFCMAISGSRLPTASSTSGILGTLFELLSLWFLAGFLEQMHSSAWVNGLYAVSVLGTAAAALAIYALQRPARLMPLPLVALFGCFGGIFGLLVAIGTLYGDTEFLLFFTIGIKARYMVVIYALISIAMLFGQQRMYAFAQLGGALAGWLYAQMAPRRGISFLLSERWYGLRNSYYRWKRRRAARKFEVYMNIAGPHRAL